MPDTINYPIVITLSQWLNAGLTYSQYEHDKERYFLRTTRACKGEEVKIEWDSILEKRKAVLRAKYGDPIPKGPQMFSDQVDPDPEAYTFFANYALSDGRRLPLDLLNEYCSNAAVLNAIGRIVNDSITMRKNKGNAVHVNNIWDNVAKAVAGIDRSTWAHTLPNNTRRLRGKYNQYRKEGYVSLIHRNFCNQNSRKVSPLMEDLFIALYTTRNRNFAKSVRDIYLQWHGGGFEIAAIESNEYISAGEFYNRADFCDENGNPLFISKATTWNYLNKPVNQPKIRSYRESAFKFTNNCIPPNHRHKPIYTLSKVSFDDFDVPRRTAKGLGEVKAYYAYEPLSQCFIGWSHSREKNLSLINDCFINMLSFLNKQNLPWPGEAEVERHLMSSLKLSLTEMFSHVHYCPHARSKRAESGIKSKKYGTDKLLYENIGRYSNKGDAYQVNQDVNTIYDYDTIVADDIYSINMHNMQPHPFFKDLTRLQVLREKMNVNLSMPIMETIMKNIGNRTETSIRRFDYVRLKHKDYRIKEDALKNLKPNNTDVTAYWLPDEDDKVAEIYLYQDDVYIGVATLIETYNEAFVERTDRDRELLLEQQKHQAHVRKRIQDAAKKIPRIEIIRNRPDYSDIIPERADVTPESDPEEFKSNDIIDDPEYWKELGKSNL